MAKGKSKLAGNSAVGAGTTSKSIMDSAVETRARFAYPRTEKQLEKSPTLMELREKLNKAPVGTTLAYTQGDRAIIMEKFEAQTTGRTGNNGSWGKTEVALNKDGSVNSYSWGDADHGYSLISTVNFYNSETYKVKKGVSNAVMDAYKKGRKNGTIEYPLEKYYKKG